MSASALAPIAVAVPLAAGCLLLAFGHYLPRVLLDGVAVSAALGSLVIDAALLAAMQGGRIVTWSGGWTPHHGMSVGIVLVVDRLGAGTALIAAVLVTCVLLYTWRYYEDAEAHFHVMLLIFLAGMTGFALSGDLFNMFVFFELMGALGYALTGFRIEDKAAVQGGLNFGVVNSFGAYVTVMGIGLLYSRTGQLGLPQLSAALAGHRADVLVVAAFVLVCTGWLVKSAAVPFHFWTADAEAAAPSPVCALFSGVMVELGVYGVARVYWTVFRRALPEHAVSRLLLVVGVVTAVLGAIMCLAQRNLKRLLAFSTIAHVGLFLIAIGVLSKDGLTGAAMYVLGHAGVKGALFLLAGMLLNHHGTVDEYALHGRGGRGVLAGLVVVAGLALAGLPPFGIGLGKQLAEDALTAGGYPWGPVIFIAVSAATGGAVLRAAGRIFFGLGPRPDEQAEATEREEMTDENETETSGPLVRIPESMLAAVAVLLLGALVVGSLPLVAPAVADGAARFTDTAGYVAAALHGTPAAPLPPADVGWTASGVLLNLLAVGLALAVAAAGLYGATLRDRLHRALAPVQSVLHGLHRVHSGNLGDYLAWLVFGVAAMLVLLGAPVLT